MKKLFILFLLMASHAISAHDGNDGWVTISNFKLWSNTYMTETIRIEVSGDGYYNPAGVCTNVDSYMVSSEQPADVIQRIYSTLLAVKIAKQSLQLRIDTNTCERDRPKIINVRLG